MDKNLKKLSRVELLELLIGLSDDYEALSSENVRLRKALSAQQHPRSTKVGSIAEAALQANGFFESAQRSADEYLREIKYLRDEFARRADTQALNQELVQRVDSARLAEAEALARLQEAQKRAEDIVARANAQAEAILSEAQSKAEQAVANANRQSHALLSQAQRQAERAAVRRGRASQESYQSSRASDPVGEGGVQRQASGAQPQLSKASTGELVARSRHSRPTAGGRAW